MIKCRWALRTSKEVSPLNPLPTSSSLGFLVTEHALPRDFERFLSLELLLFRRRLPPDLERPFPRDFERPLPRDFERSFPRDFERPRDFEWPLPRDAWALCRFLAEPGSAGSAGWLALAAPYLVIPCTRTPENFAKRYHPRGWVGTTLNPPLDHRQIRWAVAVDTWGLGFLAGLRYVGPTNRRQ